VATEHGSIALRIDLTADDARILRGALVAARATERGELERRAARHHFGYGSDAARASMDDDVVRFRRRIELLDTLLAALDAPTLDG
jgi:hypothetical protein